MADLQDLLRHPAVWRAGAASPAPGVATGWAALDAVLTGGWPRGALTELITDHRGGALQVVLPVLARRYGRKVVLLLDQALGRAPDSRAEAAYEDPLDQILHFIRLFEDMLAGLDEPYPGCLFASYISEAGLFDDETIQVARDAFILWRERLGEKFRQAAEIHPTRHDVAPESLADAILVVFEGAFLMSKTYLDAGLVAEQLQHYRQYIELLFGRE